MKIIASKHKSKKEGVCMRQAGFMSAAIKVKDDDKQERTVRLTSVELMTTKHTNAAIKEEPLAEVAESSIALKEPELKAEELA